MPCSLSHRFIFDILASFNCLAYLSRTILLSLTKRKRSPAVESTTRTDMRLTMPMNQVVGTAGSVATYSLSTARIG